jgi:hypothetical protein
MLSILLTLALAAVPPTRAVAGVVVDPSELPVPRASVRIECDDWSLDTRTGDDGRFSADVPDRACGVTVSAAGFEDSNALLPAGSMAPVVIRLPIKRVHEEVAVSAPASLVTLAIDRDAMLSMGPRFGNGAPSFAGSARTGEPERGHLCRRPCPSPCCPRST